MTKSTAIRTTECTSDIPAYKFAVGSVPLWTVATLLGLAEDQSEQR
jgi:hypothetical protein